MKRKVICGTISMIAILLVLYVLPETSQWRWPLVAIIALISSLFAMPFIDLKKKWQKMFTKSFMWKED